MKSIDQAPATDDSRQPAVTSEGEAFPSDPSRVRYVPIAAPEFGATTSIAPGVLWARIPMPMELNHINVWLLDSAEGFAAVDTGLAVSMATDAWDKIAEEAFVARPLTGVLITHIHPDHIGLARWLQQRHRVPVWMSQRTHAQAQAALSADAAVFSGADRYFRANGVIDLEQMAPIVKADGFIRMTSGLPEVAQFVNDGQAVPQCAGWTALETNGHAEGHLCLWNAQARALISGDQVLPTISSNISLSFRSSDPNPLGSFLSSLERLRALPSDTLVLPSHGAPFYGLHQRIDDLVRHHREQFDLIMRICEQPRTAVELLPHMFRRELKGLHFFLALGEALAHLEYLAHAGRLERRSTDAVVRYIAASN
ncbi:MAG TPA: MBL fold metallo-hydrolase [Steroidobacter sp.]|jgi:glyoxylase-like metal-dependent hydrolase (beta-lactamase superfamily II)|nr:MBL fold metallo-hydrolase [Steroidobacter sp.]